jgi:tetratricopeptide (TPR) repeat protein
MARILNLDGQSPEFFFHLALEQMEAGAYYDAILNLIKARDLDENPHYALQLAEAYYHTKNFEQSTNIYIGLFFGERRMAYILAIYRNLFLMGRTQEARRFVLACLKDPENISLDDMDALPEMDEEDLQRILGLVENNDIESFFDLTEMRKSFAEEDLDELRELVAKGNYDKAIMRAMEVHPDSDLYNSAQEIICIASNERGDFDLAEKTARAQSERMPDSLIAFSVLALMPDRVPQQEIEARLEKLFALVGNDPQKSVNLLRVLAQTKYNALHEKYVEQFYLLNPCVFSMIAYKTSFCFAAGRDEEGKACLRRLQMLFPRDFLARAYTGLYEAKVPKHCWQQMLCLPFCTETEAIYKKLLQNVHSQRKTQESGEKLINYLCAVMMGKSEEDISFLIKELAANSQYSDILTRFFIIALSDIHLGGGQKCDLVYGMLMNGWDTEADVMMGDTFVHCRIAALESVHFPVHLQRIYCEIYVQMISDGEKPNPEALLDIIRKMNSKGIKRSMVFEALLAVVHYLYELFTGSEDEEMEDFIEIYDANPRTVEKYLNLYKCILTEKQE